MPHSFAQDIFHKPIDQINQDDLLTYFNQERDETLLLEFKSFTDKPEDKRSQPAKEAERIRGVLKTIGAFLNSSGGLLIWGAPQPVEVMRGEKKVKVCSGSLTPVPKYYDRDDFINKLAGQIDPLPYGVRMQPITVDGGHVYLFDVPESNNKPHQYDGRYYVRMDTRTDAAPHYLVHALCNQVKTPILKLEIMFTGKLTVSPYVHQQPSITIDINVSNTTPYVHEREVYVMGWSDKLKFSDQVSNRTPVSRFHYSKLSELLPYGMATTVSCFIVLPSNFLPDTEYTFDLWYGGGKSNVTQATYTLTAHDISSTGDNHKTYSVDLKMIGEKGLDR